MLKLAGGFGVAKSFVLTSDDAAIEFVDDAGYVGAGLAIGRDAVVFVHGGGTGVVGGEGDSNVVVITAEQFVEIGGAAADVLVGSEAVVYAEVGGGAWHELHETACTSMADGVSVAVALGFDDAGEEVGVEVVVFSGVGEHEVQVGWGEFCVYPFCVCPGLRRLGVGGSRRWIRDGLVARDFDGLHFDEAAFTFAHVEADDRSDLRVVVAAHIEAVGEVDAFCGTGGERGCEGNSGEDELGS